MTKCKTCNGAGVVGIGPGIRGIKKCDACNGTGLALGHYNEIIHVLPNKVVKVDIDTVPVVRCKDCKHRFTSLCPTHSVEYNMENKAEVMWGIEEDDGFCSHGEAIK